MSNERQADITNPLMANLIRQYAHERQLLGEFNGRTAEVVRGRLMGLAASCEVNPFVVTRRDIRQWPASLDVAPSTRGACLSAVRTFYEWMNEEDLIHHNPALGIKRVKVPKGENRSLTDEELARIREVLPDGRSELIFSLMYGEALRRAEVAAILMHDIDFGRNVLHVRGKGHRGERSRSVPMSSETVRQLTDYLGQPFFVTPGPLIRSLKNPRKGISPQRVGEIAAGWMTDAGVKHAPHDGVSGHALRHSAAEAVVAEATNIRQVQQFLGHENLATTQTYLRSDIAGLQELQARRFAPGGSEHPSSKATPGSMPR